MERANNSFFPAMLKVAETGLRNQKRREKDFYDDQGFLVCGICGEKRQDIYMFPDPTADDPNRKSPIKRVRQCFCDRKAEQEEKQREQAKKDMETVSRLRSMSLMDERFADATFAKYEKNKYNEKNLRYCRRYVEAFDLMIENNQGLLFWGDVGTGKSYSAACIANALMSKKIPVVMTSFVRMLDAIKNGEEQVAQMMEKMRYAKLVIFDDLGAERGTQYALEQVYNIIDSRYRQKLPMLLTTNLTIQQMKDETDTQYKRIYDRIFETCYPIQFVGVSFRRRAAKQRFERMEQLMNGGDE